jgi:hypothetical protein
MQMIVLAGGDSLRRTGEIRETEILDGADLAGRVMITGIQADRGGKTVIFCLPLPSH